MKTTLLLCFACAVPCFAGPREHLEHHLSNPGPHLLEQFDADKDGKLSDDEKTKAREAIKARVEAALDGSGGKPKLPPRLREHLLQRFDANKDGKLDETERAAAREALEKRRAAK